MKQTLELRVSQQLTMTPQLQQAIRLLQLSTLELQQEITEALESNPLLEVDEESLGDVGENLDLSAPQVTEGVNSAEQPTPGNSADDSAATL